MQKTAQAWFTGGPSFNDNASSSGSLLDQWNAYAGASLEPESSQGFDIEAAVRSTSDKVSGTFDAVTSGVKGLPGRFQSNVSPGKSMAWFGLLVTVGAFFVFVSFTMFLPVIVLVPQKFALCFTIGSFFIVSSFFPLKGPKAQLSHMLSRPRLPFTLGFAGTMVGTIYVSLVLHSYLLSVVFSLIQVVALTYYVLSYFPGGSTGLSFVTSAVTSSVMRCFGR